MTGTVKKECLKDDEKWRKKGLQMKDIIWRVLCRYDIVARGATPENASVMKKRIRHFYGFSTFSSYATQETHGSIRTLYSYMLNQSMNGKMFPARPVKKHRARKQFPISG